jgi:hypothetical protein
MPWFLYAFIWSRFSGLIQFCDVSNSECASDCVQMSEKVQLRPRQWLDMHLRKRTWTILRCLTGEFQIYQDQNRGDRWKAKSRVCPSFPLISRGLFIKKFILVGQTFNSTYYCVIVRWLHENMQRLLSKPWLQKNWFLCHNSTPFFTSEFLSKNNTTIFPPNTLFTWLDPPVTFLCFADWRHHHFDIIEVIDAESQVALNTLAEYNFEHAF